MSADTQSWLNPTTCRSTAYNVRSSDLRRHPSFFPVHFLVFFTIADPRDVTDYNHTGSDRFRNHSRSRFNAKTIENACDPFPNCCVTHSEHLSDLFSGHSLGDERNYFRILIELSGHGPTVPSQSRMCVHHTVVPSGRSRSKGRGTGHDPIMRRRGRQTTPVVAGREAIREPGCSTMPRRCNARYML